jgi:hypothetical protein
MLVFLPFFDAQSKPGQILANVDPSKACLIVASNPLTKTHVYHKLPPNSILWYTRGSFPELRLIGSMSSSFKAAKPLVESSSAIGVGVGH